MLEALAVRTSPSTPTRVVSPWRRCVERSCHGVFRYLYSQCPSETYLVNPTHPGKPVAYGDKWTGGVKAGGGLLVWGSQICIREIEGDSL